MKETLRSATVMAGIAIASGVVYNTFGPKPVEWIRQELEIDYAGDSLFAAGITPVSDSATRTDNQMFNNNEPVDTPMVATGTSKLADAPKEALAKAEESSQTKEKKVKAVSYSGVVQALKNPEVLFIDARNADDFAKGHFDRALNIYAQEFEEKIPVILEIPRDRKIIVYCGGGNCDLSHELAEHLTNFGFTNVFVYLGGWNEWTEKQK